MLPAAFSPMAELWERLSARQEKGGWKELVPLCSGTFPGYRKTTMEAYDTMDGPEGIRQIK